MEKKNKITIKLFEEFKDDRIFALNRVNEILIFLKDKKIIDRKVGNFIITTYWIGENQEFGDFYDAQLDIEHSSKENGEDFNEMITLTIPLKRYGGEETSAEGRYSPAEYNDVHEEFDRDSYTLYYSKYWDSHDTSLQDIDEVEIELSNEMLDIAEDLILSNI